MAKTNAGAGEIQKYVDSVAAALREQWGTRMSSSTSKAMARQSIFLDYLEDLLKKNPFPAPKSVARKPKKQTKTARILNLMLSDLHYGSDIRVEETGTRYGAKEEARRTAAVVQAAANWKRQYRGETELYVHLLGDIIEGKLHDPETAAPLTEQYYRAIWNLGQALRYLSTEFKRVTVFTSPGNHGRRKDRHPGRAVNQKWDSIENMIYAGLKFALANVKNVDIRVSTKPYYVYQAFDQKGFMTHGDTVLTPGYPNRSIAVESIRRQVNEINSVEHCDLFGVGHVHVSSSTRLPSGPVFLTNGCLVPSGEYGQSIGIMNGVCSQHLWESVPGIIFGHRMEVLVDEKTDKNEGLDIIVKPFPGVQEFSDGSVT